MKHHTIHHAVIAVIILGFGSGFALLFSSHILLTWMLDSGIKLEFLGWISCLSLPYLSSFTWMPVLDYIAHCGGIQRQALMKVNFFTVGCLLLYLSKLTPNAHYLLILIVGFTIAFVSATQDHIIEAYRINMLPKSHYKPAVNLSMVAFRVALIVAGGGGIVFAKHFSWSLMLKMASLVMFSLAFLTHFMPKEEMFKTGEGLHSHYQQAILLIRGLKDRKRFLATLMTHRLGIFWLESMLPVLMVKLLGLSMMDVGRLYQWYGVLGLILGSFIINYKVDTSRLTWMIYKCLMLQLVLYLGFYGCTLAPQVGFLTKLLVFFECALQGLLATISSLWIMQKVTQSLPAFSISLWYGLGSMGRVVVGPLAAWVIAHLGWGPFMVIGMLISLIPVILIRTKFATATPVIA